MTNSNENSQRFDLSNPQDVDALAALAALDAVDSDDQFLVRRLLETNDDFASSLLAYRDVAARFAPDASTPAPDRLRERVMSSITETPRAEKTEKTGDTTSTQPSSTGSAAKSEENVVPMRRRRPVMWTAAAAVVVLLVGTAVIIPQITQPEVRELQADVAGGVVEVSYSEGADEAEISLRNIPAPPEGRAYQMWVVDETGAHSAGVMEPKDVTATVDTKIGGFENATAFMISQEPTGGSQTPSTPVVEFKL